VDTSSIYFSSCFSGWLPIKPPFVYNCNWTTISDIKIETDIKSVEHKLSLYADDSLLYISDPLSYIIDIINVMHDFGTFPGYKLNI